MTIKEFAELCNCKTQTLRYYDQIGLLKPDRVDHYSGYRFYQPEQAMEFIKIKKFQEAMFSIEEIKKLLKKSDDEVLAHFDQKIAEQEIKLECIKAIKQSYRKESIHMEETLKENQKKILELSNKDVDVYFASNLVEDFLTKDGMADNGKLTGKIEEIRKRLREKNVDLPIVHFSDHELLENGEYMICSKGKMLKHSQKRPDGKTIDQIAEDLYELYAVM